MMLDLFLAAALLVQQSPVGLAPADDSFIRDATIRPVDYVMFHQEIDDENVDRVARLLKPGVILDLQSIGGDMRASLRMARLVRSQGVRVRISGECASGCAVVWATARDRLADGFSAATFHGNPISGWNWISAHRDQFSAEEVAWAEAEHDAFRDFLTETGVQPWLFQCASRLQNPRHTILAYPQGYDRVTTEVDYEMVWFPRAILEAAGVTGLDRYDPPNARQREAIETEFGTASRARRVYWAQDGDCDPDRQTAAGSEAQTGKA